MTHWSLRTRVAWGSVLVVAAVLMLAGALLVRGFAREQQAELDRALLAQAERARRPVALAAARGGDLTPGAEVRALRGPATVVRAVDDNGAVVTLGDALPDLPTSTSAGLTTIGGWRVLTLELPADLRLQLAAPLEQVRASVARLRRRATVLGLLALAVTGTGAYVLSSLALRPLGRLRAAAEHVAATRDLASRVPEEGSDEVVGVARSLNTMLARLQEASAATEAALEASRRFAADAGHELRTPLTSMQANLDALARNPDLPLDERARLLADVAEEQRRLVALLDALQALARADAALPPPAPVDVAEALDRAVARVRTHHPEARVAVSADDEPVLAQGWAEGVELLARNLLENAVRHGGGQVTVRLVRDDGAVVLTVDDEGPGIPLDERGRVLERFVRGRNAAPTGSGLGLALVAQQARLHGGEVRIGDAPGGGARVEVWLPATGPDRKDQGGADAPRGVGARR